MKRDAFLSECGRYRYWLMREWAAGPPCVFVMLNPSTADAHLDDPTLRKCLGYAQRWGYGRLEVINLFAYRSPHRKLLRTLKPEVAVGPDNDNCIQEVIGRASKLVLAWGNEGFSHQR